MRRARTAPTALACLLLAATAGAASAPSMLVYPPFRHSLGFHKVTAFQLFVYLGTRTRFEQPGALVAVKFASEDDPGTPRDDDELTVLGLNTGRCEIIYNTSLTSADLFGRCGSGPGQFRNPQGIAAEPDGDVYVADTGNDRIVRLRYENDRLRFVGSFGRTGRSNGEFSSPSDVAVGASGTLYIADTGNDRVVIAGPLGEPLGAIRGDPDEGVMLDRPTALAVVEQSDPWAASPHTTIVVVDRDGTRLSGFSPDSRAFAVARVADIPLAGVRLARVAIDFYGSVHATDTALCQIHKFDRDLHYVASFGGCGRGHHELDEPRGITIWRRFGQVFVTERSGAQYFWIGTEVRNLFVRPTSIVPVSAEASIEYTLTETSRVTVELLDERGRPVRTLVNARRRALGRNTERWDGTGTDGRSPLPAGVYRVRVTATPTYASGSYVSDSAETLLRLTAPRGS